MSNKLLYYKIKLTCINWINFSGDYITVHYTYPHIEFNKVAHLLFFLKQKKMGNKAGKIPVKG